MKTVFLTGGTGFLGAEVLAELRRSHPDVDVRAIARGDAGARALAEAGVAVVRGDLSEPGPWRDALQGCDVVIHAAQPQAWGQKVTTAVARAWEARRLVQERHLLGAAPRDARVVYVSGSSWLGDTGAEPADERMVPRPCGWGPYLEAPQAQARQLAHERGLDLVTAWPSAVYGPGSWFEESMLRPIAAGRRVYALLGAEAWFSPIHLSDCARALVHLARVDAAALDAHGRSVLLVDDEPMPALTLATLTGEALGRPVRRLPLPGPLVALLAGEVVRSYLASRSVFRNDRLKALGFDLGFPTARVGVPDVVARWRQGGETTQKSRR